MQVVAVAGFSPIVRDTGASWVFYAGGLGADFEGSASGEYVYTEKLDGVKHLGLWPLSQAAQACFGTRDWPRDIPVPQATIEFEVDAVEQVAAAAHELESGGYQLIHQARTEPWNQTITRLLSPEGLLVGVCYTPSFY